MSKKPVGKPPLSPEGSVFLNGKVTPEQLAFVAELGEGNLSLGLRRAIDAASARLDELRTEIEMACLKEGER